METICRADLPGATLPLKGVIPLAAQGGGRAEMQSYTRAAGTTTVSRTTPHWPLLLPGWDSYQRELGLRYSWSSLDPTVPNELLEEYGHLFVPPRLGNFIPSPVSNQVISLFLPIPQHIWVGKSAGDGGGFEVLKMFLPGRRRKMSCYPWAVHPGPGMLEDAQGHGWVQGPEGLWEIGDQGWQL